MFDGLKDKLSGFTSDVEEDVDEEAVEDDVEDEAAESELDTVTPDTGDESPVDSDDAVESDAAGEAAEAETADDTAEVETEAGAAAEPAEVDSDEDAAAEPAEADTSADADTADTSTDDSAADTSADADTAADDGVPSLASDEADDEDDGGRSFTEKAKIMATGKTVIEEEDLQKHLDDLELALLSSDVEMSVANEILGGVEANLTGETRRRLSSTGNLVRDALREALFDVISVGQFDFDERVQSADKPVVIIFTGVNGVGKTTTIAKLAQYFEDRGLSTVLANGDTYRAGANEQLEKHAENLGKKIITHEQGSDPTAVVYDAVEYANANDIDVVLGDTAGRLHTSDDLMAQLAKIDRNIDPDMTLFVDEAVAGQDAVNRAREFDDAAEIDGAILTKADADPQGGAAISVAHVTGKPILFLGTGQDYDDLESFDPEAIVDSLFEA